MRIFIAIPLPPAVQETLAVKDDKTEAVRWQPPELLHLTIKFIGEITEERLGTLTAALSDINQPKFEFAIEGWGAFPGRERPRVVWAGVKEIQPLMRLHDQIEEVCQRLGVETDERPFTPHVTLGRVKGNVNHSDLAALMKERTAQKRMLKINSFCVYESNPGSNHAEHTVIKEYVLDTPADGF